MNLIEDIKAMLVEENGDDSWEDFVDSQEVGDCQWIVDSIKQSFSQVTSIFGEVDIDEPYIDEDGDEQFIMTHHWIKYKGKILDFSKGTLQEYIDFMDIYDPVVDNSSIYHARRSE